ncbi:unknown [Peptostreptococcus anaerobius CAG:621]|nr:unknown [Peptostreptococcus anaerobius CAG:621]
MECLTILDVASAIVPMPFISTVSSFLKVNTISAIFEVWSPIRSISVIIFRAEDIFLRSLATGCCWSNNLRHSLSMSFSIWSISSSASITALAWSVLPSIRALVASAIAISHNSPIRVRSSSSFLSFLSKIFSLTILTKPSCYIVLCTLVCRYRE